MSAMNRLLHYRCVCVCVVYTLGGASRYYLTHLAVAVGAVGAVGAAAAVLSLSLSLSLSFLLSLSLSLS